jgi:hypothetical protein
MELVRRGDVHGVNVIPPDEIRGGFIDCACMVIGKPSAELRMRVRSATENEIWMCLNDRNHGSAGHSKPDDTDPNRPIRFFRLPHLLLTRIGFALGRSNRARLSTRRRRYTDRDDFRGVAAAFTLSHQGQAPGITS